MNILIHFDRPAGFLLNNISQGFSGWLAVPMPAEIEDLQVVVDDRATDVVFYRRDDVEQAMPGHQVICWTFHLDRTATMGQARRTLELKLLLGGQCVYTRHFYKSKNLRPVGQDGPLFFMHIPKTAGTALRQLIDYAFHEFPTLAIYETYPGISIPQAVDSLMGFTRSRELLFGHYDFEFVRALDEVNPKVVTIFREPAELARSYLAFNENPAPEFLDNPLIRHLCGLSYTPPFGLISERHLERALSIIERNVYILQQDRLQEFADDVSAAFALPHFTIPQINQSPAVDGSVRTALPFDVSFDRQIYDACRERAGNFLDFLNA